MEVIEVDNDIRIVFEEDLEEIERSVAAIQENAEDEKNETIVGSYSGTELDDSENVYKNNSGACGWGTRDTNYLLKKYNRYIMYTGLGKRFKTKKIMYNRIAQDLKRDLNLTRTGLQCENRYKTILRRWRLKNGSKEKHFSNDRILASENTMVEEADNSSCENARVVYTPKEKNNSSANERIVHKPKEVNHSSNETTRVIHKPIEINSPSHENAKVVHQPNEVNNFSNENDDVGNNKSELCQVLWQMFKRKEQSRERRHREKIELMKKIFDIRE